MPERSLKLHNGSENVIDPFIPAAGGGEVVAGGGGGGEGYTEPSNPQLKLSASPRQPLL
jgi:hypothetical protein